MLQGNKIVVVMPAYNAARTLRQTYDEVIGHDIVDEINLVDDASRDETATIARTLPRVRVEVHPQNRGYGGNQKTCYRLALAAGADVVIMLHSDYQVFALKLLEQLPLEKNSDHFVFDNQVLAQILWLTQPIGEVTCPAKYM